MDSAITELGCRARRDRLWNALDHRPDAILLHSPRNLTWLTGYYPSPFLFSSQNAGAMLLLTPDGHSLLAADNLLVSFAEKAWVDAVECPVWYRGRESAPRRDDLLIRSVLDHLRLQNLSAIAVDSAVPALLVDALRAETPDLRIVDIGPAIHSLMRSKHSDEVAAITRSIRAAEAGFEAALRGIAPGITELQAYELILAACTEAAGEPVTLYGDFASGPRTEGGGGGPTARVIQANDLFILDCSVVIQGYRGDFANTFVVAAGHAGRVSGRLRQMEEACRAALQAGESSLKPRSLGRDVHEAIHGEFKRRGFDALFSHHSGHGIGLGHPDPPYLVPESEDALQIGDVVTLEPGLYEAGTGGMRFERNYLIVEQGAETLTRHKIGLTPD